jgi:hypothetical protein
LIHYGFDNAGFERRGATMQAAIPHGLNGAEEADPQYRGRY